LEDALCELLGEPIKVSAAGRTDAGVHASGQVVSFMSFRNFPFERLSLALGSLLPPDVGVRDTAIVEASFSARFSATERTYVYAIHNRPERAPLTARYAWHVWRPIQVARMQAAAPALIGEHDFRSFCGILPDNDITVRRISQLRIEARGDFIRIEITAGGFLHRMVRTIVGTLLECATGRRDPAELPVILRARDRRAAGCTAPPNGLYLAGVRYGDGYCSYGEPPIFRWGTTVS
jgi:tRNA pseudouridine38-40 synthase